MENTMEKAYKQSISVLLKNFPYLNPDNKKSGAQLVMLLNKPVTERALSDFYNKVTHIIMEENKIRKAQSLTVHKDDDFTLCVKRLIITMIDFSYSTLSDDSSKKGLLRSKEIIEKSVFSEKSSRLMHLIKDLTSTITQFDQFLQEERSDFFNMLNDFNAIATNLQGTTEHASSKLMTISGEIKNTQNISDFNTLKHKIVSDIDEINGEFETLKEAIKHNCSEMRLLRKKIEELKKDSESDPLTQILNRRGFEKVLSQEIERVKRYNSLRVIVLIDIDEFKKINDNFGHLAGDEVLKAFVSGIIKNIRTNDTFGRIGGDEFAIIFQECSLKEVENIFKKIFLFFDKNVYNTGKEKLKISLSAGAAQIESHSSTRAILDKADKAMYVSKQGGRNKLTIVS